MYTETSQYCTSNEAEFSMSYVVIFIITFRSSVRFNIFKMKQRVFVANSDFLISYLCNPMSGIFQFMNSVRSNNQSLKWFHDQVGKDIGIRNYRFWLNLLIP